MKDLSLGQIAQMLNSRVASIRAEREELARLRIEVRRLTECRSSEVELVTTAAVVAMKTAREELAPLAGIRAANRASSLLFDAAKQLEERLR